MTLPNRNLTLVFSSSLLRSFAVGGLGVTIGLYLASLGFDETRIGVAISAGMAGMACGNLLPGFLARRCGRRKSLLVLSTLMAVSAVLLTVVESYAGVVALLFFGMVNGMGRDRSAAQALDQTIVAQSATAANRTAAFSQYTFLADVGTGLGALAAGMVSSSGVYHAALVVYSAVVVCSGLLAQAMDDGVEVESKQPEVKLSPQSRRSITVFASLSVLDSLGGGFITRALLSYWFVQRFDVDAVWVGVLFGGSSFVNATSYFAAARLARRFGLLNTMVFTHIPSSILLLLVPFAPSFPVAVALFLVREFFAPMDVPTRQSYLAAIVADHERATAAGIANVARNSSWAVGPVVSGWAMTISAAAPLLLAGTIKIVYDLLLWRAFRRLRPPEEVGGGTAS